MSSDYFGSDEHKRNADNARIFARRRLQEMTEERKKEYYKNPKRCTFCGGPIPYEKQKNKFCSKHCSNTNTNLTKGGQRLDTREKISSSLLKYYETHPGPNSGTTHKGGPGPKGTRVEHRMNTCVFCGKSFDVCYSNFGRKHCSRKCAHEHLLRNVENGTHKGWTSRNVTSYPEKFFIRVLEGNDLDFEINYPVNKKDLGMDNSSLYFLDFFFVNKGVDLEIDGRQHEDRVEHDKIRDAALSSVGIHVYRIKWKRISTPKGKEYIKNEIEKFLNFLKSKELRDLPENILKREKYKTGS